MGRPRKDQSAEPVGDAPSGNEVDDIVSDFISTCNGKGTGTKAYLQGQHAQSTWGIKIPYLAFSWLVGGSTVLPAQRLIGFSGATKSFKSTLKTEIGNWFIAENGLHIDLDNEGKTSASMLDAMTWFSTSSLVKDGKRRIFKETGSIDEWQVQVTEALKKARKLADRPKGQRVPIFITIDSITGKSSEDAQEKIMKEGSAESRGFAVDAMKTSKFFSALSLLGTTCNLGFVQHLVQDLSAPPGYNGPVMKEKGAVTAAYLSSLNIRVSKGQSLRMADHPFALQKGPPVEGYTLYLNAVRTCIGPDGNVLPVDILWQYVDQEDGTSKQAMWYDWYGALGNLLLNMKYNDKQKLYEHEKEKLDKALYFVQPKPKRVKCEELGLDGVTASEFGKAIETNPEIRSRIAKLLNVVQYPHIQEANIDVLSTDD
jgi:hypothetical protein